MRTIRFLKWHSVACCVLRWVVYVPRNTQYLIVTMLLLLSTLLLTAACNNNVSTEPVPPTIHYGEDLCQFCNMIISEERFAAGYLTQDGEERIFDDIGGMFQYHLQEQEEVMAFFVHDYEEKSWIRAEKAYYVLSEELPTPMLFGIIACTDLEKAELIASNSDGAVLTFDEALAHYQEAMMPVDGSEANQHTHMHQ